MTEAQSVVYDCDTSPYWVNAEAYQDRNRKFGRFIEDGAAYEILDRETPRPWLNYLCNEKFGSVVANDGLGFTFYKTTLLRVTKYEHPIDYLPREFQDGRKLYVKDPQKGKTWDVFKDAEDLRCVHRPGSTTLTAELDGLEIEMRVFVPLRHSAECWSIRIRGQENRVRELEVAAEQTWTFSKFGIHTAEEGIPYLSTPGKDLTVTTEPGKVLAHSFNPDLPFPLYGLFASPQLKNSQCTDEVSKRKDGRTFVFKRGRLADTFRIEPKGELKLDVLSGVAETKEEFEGLKARFNAPSAFGEEWEGMSNRWKDLLETPSCEIPQSDLQNFLNVWFKNQLYLNFRFVRSGFIGYRDTLQDTWGYTLLEPDLARQNLLRTLSHMKGDGSCPRNYSIIDEKHDMRKFMDSGTWIAMTLVDYVKETGDLGILDEKIPYLGKEAPDSVGSHVWRALELLYANRGRHGVCLVGEGDWNDALEGISKSGAAESVWLTMALYHAQNLMAELYGHAKDSEREKILRQRSAELKKILHQEAWDGDWFVYGFTGSGKPIGSKNNKEGKIHLNAQTWAMLTGLADPGQAEKMKKAIEQYLETDLGPALLGPPYVEEGAEVGRIAKLQPGTFENGSIYQHAVAFGILADIQTGHAEKAYQTLLHLLPTNPENFDSRRTSEPYCTGNYYCGPGHPRYGQNFFTWFTGNASWLLRIGFDHLLGVKAEFDGLRIDPKVPAAWNEFSVQRHFRGCHYHIHFQRAAGDKKGLWVESRKVEGNLIEPQSAKKMKVEVFY